MSKIYAVQGDSLPLVTLTITDLDDNLVSIAGCTGANAYMRKLGETAVQTIVTTVDAGAGTVSFDFSNGEATARYSAAKGKTPGDCEYWQSKQRGLAVEQVV